ncbi:NADH dehydrogenase I, chain L [gamma proteobacterium HdN1]|nr:NADH dehydrogenase I, chain L [gamma proteobacterium HdN1]
MLNAIACVTLLPLFGFFVLTLLRPPERVAAWIGCGTVAAAAAILFTITIGFLQNPPAEGHAVVHYGTWVGIGSFQPGFSAWVDMLTLTMLCIITGVGFLIHVYSAGYMVRDEGFARYFSYLNLFIAAMTVLVMADNLLLLFMGWEGVGLCSYLLIGFWYRDPANGAAARKAFIVTRVGDTAMIIGFFMLYLQFSTIDIAEILRRSHEAIYFNQSLYTVVALLLLGGAVGKSAQLPLQTWLPDAMAGPTPVSALIHAATMVTAGVYLIARTHPLFMQAPLAQHAVGWVGLLTLLIAGASALVQVDIKRILAYSTISQIGYMFLGLGVGAWSASIFHLMTHAFFKALLFLSAGTVIFCLHHKQDITEMGGLRKLMPLTFASFVIGCGSLASLPLITSGFYSKDEILIGAWNSGEMAFFWGGVVGALITAVYSFRLVFVVFFGAPKTHPDHAPTLNMQVPLVLLGILSVMGGAIHLRLDGVLPIGSHEVSTGGHGMISALLIVLPLVGVALAWWLYRRGITWTKTTGAPAAMLFFRRGWAFDALYDAVLVHPWVWLATVNRSDVVDSGYTAVARLTQWLYQQASITQTGSVRWYAGVMIFGFTLILSAAVFL